MCSAASSVKAPGAVIEPRLATGDGALGFWKALAQVFPTTRCQRCWVHKTANVLDKLPKRIQPHAKAMLHDIWMAATKAEANRALDLFLATYEAKYPHATDCLARDRETLLTFYDFPADGTGGVAGHGPIEPSAIQPIPTPTPPRQAHALSPQRAAPVRNRVWVPQRAAPVRNRVWVPQRAAPVRKRLSQRAQRAAPVRKRCWTLGAMRRVLTGLLPRPVIPVPAGILPSPPAAGRGQGGGA